MRFVLVLFLLAADGCSSNGAGPSPAKPKFESVELHRSACFGLCPVYTVKITADGKVEFKGEKHVASRGRHTGLVDASGMRRLDDAVSKSNFFALREQYYSQVDGCTSWASDNPTVDIVVSMLGKLHHVSYYYGCTVDVGASIDTFARTIDEVASVQQWVGVEPSNKSLERTRER